MKIVDTIKDIIPEMHEISDEIDDMLEISLFNPEKNIVNILDIHER